VDDPPGRIGGRDHSRNGERRRGDGSDYGKIADGGKIKSLGKLSDNGRISGDIIPVAVENVVEKPINVVVDKFLRVLIFWGMIHLDASLKKGEVKTFWQLAVNGTADTVPFTFSFVNKFTLVGWSIG
jgi:hypothetical protein